MGFSPKTALSRDVPRPRDSSLVCLERIRVDKSCHAVCDLVDALEREQDPRFEILAAKLHHNMQRVAAARGTPQEATVAVSYFHDFAVWAVRVMEDPTIARQAQTLKDALGIKTILLPP
jgi:hypothetical protein